MTYASLEDFLARGRDALTRGPVAMIFVEDDVEMLSTLAHHLKAGFRSILVFTPISFDLPAEMAERLQIIACDTRAGGAVARAVTAIAGASPEGNWLYYGFNAEYLFFPFCESRRIGEMLAFHTEERRDAILSYVVDVYAEDLDAHQNAVDLESAQLDRSGYYSLARCDAAGRPKERQFDFFGGLRWRFEEHIPFARRKIDRVALFRAQKGLRLREDHTFNIEEYNTYSCPWHHNITTAVASFRTAKALKTNPGSKHAIRSFSWRNSQPFRWSSQQLMDLGLMEPGQWF